MFIFVVVSKEVIRSSR